MGAMQPSIRLLFLGQVMLCIIIVASLCTSLAVWSGDRALSDTEDSCEESITTAFTAGQTTVLAVTDDHLNQVGDSTVKTLDTFWAVPRNAAAQMCRQLMSHDTATMESWDYLYTWRRSLYHMVSTHTEYDGVGIVTLDHQTVQVVEHHTTLARGPEEYHHYTGNINNGTAYDTPGGIPARNRTAQCDILTDGSGDCYGYPQQGLTFPFECDGSWEQSSMSNGTQMQVPCIFPDYNLYNMHMSLLPYQPIEAVRWTPLISLGPWTGIIAQCVYGDALTGRKVGLAYSGTDMRKISEFLQTIDLGQSRGSLGRIFATVRHNWVSPAKGDQVGYLAGTSHGTSLQYLKHYGDRLYKVGPIPATNCSDELVSYTAKYMNQPFAVNETLTQSLYETVHQRRVAHPFQMPTNRTPAGETFYISVKVFDDGRGLNWFVNSVIDRVYILGQVDAMNKATHAAVRANKDKVSSQLHDARIIMFVVVVTVALLPIVLSVFLVFRVTEPLVQLMQEMAHVAVMNLEVVNVDRPASNIAEVRDMEVSFKQMLKNLVEYRQYLPQSVLYDSATDEEVACLASESAITSADAHGFDRTNSSNVSSEVMLGRALFDSTLRTRSVTILVTNVCSLHAISRGSAMGDMLASY